MITERFNVFDKITKDRDIVSIYKKYNATDEDIKDITLHNMFKEAAEKYPNNIAIIRGEEKITYDDLDKKSNQVANYLLIKGIPKGSLVAVMVPRKITSIINILGILKAGFSYVPIDPEYPKKRIDFILSNSKCQLLLDESIFNNGNIENFDDQGVCVDVDPNTLAYVIYTSGSTGLPKGVKIKHKAASNTIIDIINKFNVNEKDNIIALSSMCFDLSVFDIFGSLASGATLVQIDDPRDITDVVNVINKNHISIWNSVPLTMNMLVDNIKNDTNNDLRLVLLSGDTIPLKLPHKIKDKFKNSRVISLGGATEASIWSIYYPIDYVDSRWNGIPYGMPLANQKMYVVNSEGSLCDEGIEGEICIAGKGLAEGYLNDEEKTKEAFIENTDLGRIYKTGDYGVLSDNGYIEFRGRKDNQVKIRGYRIELIEIENVINKYKDIRWNVVSKMRDSSDNDYLCAYYIASDSFSMQEFKEYLNATLPQYMIPSKFQELQEIPQTENGKVNRKSLMTQRIDVEKEEINDEIEIEIIKIFEDILQTGKKINRDDNFYEIGINSIIIVNVLSKIKEKFKIQIKFKEFLKQNNVLELSNLVKKLMPNEDEKNKEKDISKMKLQSNTENNKNRISDKKQCREIEYRKPVNSKICEKLTKIFELILGKENGIEREENFYEMGINSIMIVKIISKINEEFNIEIKFKEFLKQNNIIELSELIRKSISPRKVCCIESENCVSNNQVTKGFKENDNLMLAFDKTLREKCEDIFLIYNGENISYGDFEVNINRFAYYLISSGVNKKDCIAILDYKNIETLYAVLGALKVGVKYVCIDLEVSMRKINTILKNNNCKMLLDVNKVSCKLNKDVEQLERKNLFDLNDTVCIMYTNKGKNIINYKQLEDKINSIRNNISEKSKIATSIECSAYKDLSFIIATIIEECEIFIIDDKITIKEKCEIINKNNISDWKISKKSQDDILEYIRVEDFLVNNPVDNDADEVNEDNEYIIKDVQEDIYYWSPIVKWRINQDTVIVGEDKYKGKIFCDIVPQIYFIAQEGIKIRELKEKLSDISQEELISIINEFINNNVLIKNIVKVEDLFATQDKLLRHNYGLDLLFKKEAYYNFKKKQLNRSVNCGNTESIKLDNEFYLPDIISNRRSCREFDIHKEIPFSTFSMMLSVFKQSTKNGKKVYNYASAGGLYPIDIYIYIKENRVENLARGLYYYNPIKNQLNLINEKDLITSDAHYFTNKKIFEGSAFSIFFVYNAEVSMPRYAGAGYLYSLIDTGIMVSTLSQICEVLNLGTCSIGDMNFDKIQNNFKLTNNQKLIHVVEGGIKLHDNTVKVPNETEFSKTFLSQINNKLRLFVDYCNENNFKSKIESVKKNINVINI